MRPLLSKICATYASQLRTYVLYCKATHLRLMLLLVVVLQVLCALCEPPTKLKYSGNTTNLFSHLRNKHPVTHNKLQRSSSSASSLSKLGSSSQSANSCTHALVEGKLFSLQIFSPACKKVPLHPRHQCSF